MKDKDFLLWIHARLEKVYGESRSVDFMDRLLAIAQRTDPAQHTPIGYTFPVKAAPQSKLKEPAKMCLTPFDAEDPAFRLVFEEVLKRSNWPAARKGEGYRSPMTQMAWEVSFSVVNLLNLHRCVELPATVALRTAPSPTAADVRKLIEEAIKLGERDGNLPPPPKYPPDL